MESRRKTIVENIYERKPFSLNAEKSKKMLIIKSVPMNISLINPSRDMSFNLGKHNFQNTALLSN